MNSFTDVSFSALAKTSVTNEEPRRRRSSARLPREQLAPASATRGIKFHCVDESYCKHRRGKSIFARFLSLSRDRGRVFVAYGGVGNRFVHCSIYERWPPLTAKAVPKPGRQRANVEELIRFSYSGNGVASLTELERTSRTSCSKKEA